MSVVRGVHKEVEVVLEAAKVEINELMVVDEESLSIIVNVVNPMIFLGKLNVVIIDIVLVCHCPSLIFFDPRCIFSNVSTYFATGIDAICESIAFPIHVSTLVGDSLVVDRVYRS